MDFLHQHGLISSFTMFILLLLLPLASSSDPASTGLIMGSVALPGCSQTCGNVTVPYPFGMAPHCYRDPSFWVNCTTWDPNSPNTPSSEPKPYISVSNIEITNITLNGQLHVLAFMASDCYYQNGTRQGGYDAQFRVSKFTYNSSMNVLAAIGCDTQATLTGVYSYNQNYTTGCIASCGRKDDVADDGSCSGIGCCSVSLANWLRQTYLTVGSYYNHINVWNFNPCSFAFVIEKDAFKFASSNLSYNMNFGNSQLPRVLDWVVGNESCAEAQQNSTGYACKLNTHCYEPYQNSGYRSGYRCTCTQGFRGNPYLDGDNGCTDIDECIATDGANRHDCSQNALCINTDGSYRCVCLSGYRTNNGGHGEQGCLPEDRSSKLQKIILSIGGSILVLLLLGSWVYIAYKRRSSIRMREKYFKDNGGFILKQRLAGDGGAKVNATIFGIEELEKATNNFHESTILGQGGYGTVYKGILANGSLNVAIKKSKVIDRNQIDQFINEVIILSQLVNHKNIVKLLGCCLETEIPLLVYEFVDNGTLFEHLHDGVKARAFSWDIRLRVAAEAAGVLWYLHSTASQPIIHRDVKSMNILLDSNYTAKVSDFGASKLIPTNESQLSTMVQGTLGYLDPEYFHTSQLTEKSDVYSFGVVLVELLTGKKAFSYDGPEKERCLINFFLSTVKENCLLEILDSNMILGNDNMEQVREVGRLAKRCLNVKGEERPTMKEVAMELEGLRILNKHSWIESQENREETESLLGGSLIIPISSGSMQTGRYSGQYDSIRDQVALKVSDGR